MYYKVIYNDKVIDALDGLVFLKYQEKYDRMILCEESEAQAILSSDEEYIWHEESLLAIPVSRYDTVRVEEIDFYEYKQIRALKDAAIEKDRIIDKFVKTVFIDGDTAQLLESVRRLYENQVIQEADVIEFCESFGIAEEEKLSIIK